MDRRAFLASSATLALAPLGEMPATTVELACRYAPTSGGLQRVGPHDYIVLRRMPKRSCSATAAGSANDVAMGRAFAVPQRTAPGEFIVAHIELRPTALTRLQTLLWHAPRASIHVEYAGGTGQDWRVVADTVSDGLVVSPAPRNDAEAAAFFAGQALPAVRSVTLLARPGAYALDSVTFTRVRRDVHTTAR